MYAGESVSMENTKSFKDREIVGYNRLHADIPAAVRVKSGEVFRADARQLFDGVFA
jgi:formamidase